MSNVPEINPVTEDGIRHCSLADGIERITLCTPGKPNLVNIGLSRALLRAIERVAAREDVRVLLLDAAGPMFSAGGDIEEIEQSLADPGRLLAAMVDAFHAVVLALRRLKVPVVVAVQGAAAG